MLSLNLNLNDNAIQWDVIQCDVIQSDAILYVVDIHVMLEPGDRILKTEGADPALYLGTKFKLEQWGRSKRYSKRCISFS